MAQPNETIGCQATYGYCVYPSCECLPVKADQKQSIDGRMLAAKLNETFRRHCGLTHYVHDSNRRNDEANMYDTLEELGMLPNQEQP